MQDFRERFAALSPHDKLVPFRLLSAHLVLVEVGVRCRKSHVHDGLTRLRITKFGICAQVTRQDHDVHSVAHNHLSCLLYTARSASQRLFLPRLWFRCRPANQVEWHRRTGFPNRVVKFGPVLMFHRWSPALVLQDEVENGSVQTPERKRRFLSVRRREALTKRHDRVACAFVRHQKTGRVLFPLAALFACLAGVMASPSLYVIIHASSVR